MAAPEMNSMSLFLGRYFLPFGVIKGKRDELSCAVLFVSMNPVLFLALCAAVCEATAPRTTFVGSFLFTDLAWGFTIFGALPRLWPCDYVLNAVSPFRHEVVPKASNVRGKCFEDSRGRLGCTPFLDTLHNALQPTPHSFFYNPLIA
eukprot:m.119453 g.119453  ORF g.119453 m.119453 type:complete len:147 (+) comp13295_c0_seq4:76-516(+)